MTLLEAKEGEWLVVTSISYEEIAWQAMRFGIDEGSYIRIEKKLTGGPVIIVKNQLEIASISSRV